VSERRSIAVALHDVEPSTFERCALIRDWLGDHDIDRVTLLVIPAPDLHPFADRSPGLAAWLNDCAARGDAIAQHGLQHRQVRRAPAGRRLLRLAGVEPRGFVAPAYAYTPALHEAVGATFDWWASLGWLHRAGPMPRRPTLAPALCLGTSTGLKRAASPWLVRAGAALSGDVLRLDLHPADLDHPAHIGALEGVLRRARRRVAVTYDDLA
jgi:predicted deacetylase